MNLNNYSKEKQRELIAQHTREFLARGGQITVCPPQLSPLEQRRLEKEQRKS